MVAAEACAEAIISFKVTSRADRFDFLFGLADNCSSLGCCWRSVERSAEKCKSHYQESRSSFASAETLSDSHQIHSLVSFVDSGSFLSYLRVFC